MFENPKLLETVAKCFNKIKNTLVYIRPNEILFSNQNNIFGKVITNTKFNFIITIQDFLTLLKFPIEDFEDDTSIKLKNKNNFIILNKINTFVNFPKKNKENIKSFNIENKKILENIFENMPEFANKFSEDERVINCIAVTNKYITYLSDEICASVDMDIEIDQEIFLKPEVKIFGGLFKEKLEMDIDERGTFFKNENIEIYISKFFMKQNYKKTIEGMMGLKYNKINVNFKKIKNALESSINDMNLTINLENGCLCTPRSKIEFGVTGEGISVVKMSTFKKVLGILGDLKVSEIVLGINKKVCMVESGNYKIFLPCR